MAAVRPLNAADVAGLRGRLVDARGGRVAFLSHCLLNENVRYLGGATRPGTVGEIVGVLEDAGVGIVQMPCPEEVAWGGVLKPWLLLAYGARRRWWNPLTGVAHRAGLAWTRCVYRRLARRIVKQMRDYQKAGVQVLAVVGVGGSPSCGVLSTLDLTRAKDALADIDPYGVTTDGFNQDVLARNVVPGRGLFLAELRTRLIRRGVDVSLLEHDLLAELGGRPSTAVPELRRLSEPPSDPPAMSRS